MISCCAARLIEHACLRTATTLNLEYRRGLADLAVIAGTAPLVGFLGGAIGIIGSFRGVSGEKSAMLAMTAGNLSESQWLTAAGLLLGIVALMTHRYLDNRAEDLALEMRLAPAALIRQLGEYQSGPWIATPLVESSACPAQPPEVHSTGWKAIAVAGLLFLTSVLLQCVRLWFCGFVPAANAALTAWTQSSLVWVLSFSLLLAIWRRWLGRQDHRGPLLGASALTLIWTVAAVLN